MQQYRHGYPLIPLTFNRDSFLLKLQCAGMQALDNLRFYTDSVDNFSILLLGAKLL